MWGRESPESVRRPGFWAWARPVPSGDCAPADIRVGCLRSFSHFKLILVSWESSSHWGTLAKGGGERSGGAGPGLLCSRSASPGLRFCSSP